MFCYHVLKIGIKSLFVVNLAEAEYIMHSFPNYQFFMHTLFVQHYVNINMSEIPIPHKSHLAQVSPQICAFIICIHKSEALTDFLNENLAYCLHCDQTSFFF